ncbi:NLP/P60 protein [Xylanimonas cellulosilytica DSM 15894]|uniref:NLP/P60 protein n=1 Tax=Xylanimonas cellulosilytica (strain DSM 15894 / JCM 12276 / CECT 5975 / KCTC 9989 / LMG 20990 / NBRC 107835 / XIL07) TaxID=446471 RepID=D1BYI5_XYLCX|nr:C40 family peptidase [Xylanimonas cellulosilytica]ACZ31857.1 NLP/P60 protein [Xylanimonas cellulosilytica DSM 15894]
MTARTTSARHRAARRPLTPLSGLNQNAAVVGRRAAVVATAGGILVSTFATAAQAAPVENTASKLSTVDLGALTEQAREALQAAPVVTVSPDAQVDVETVSAETAVQVEAAPKPKPVVQRASTVSRTADRSAVAAPAAAYSSQAASIALRYDGVRYVVGGASPDGFDCSGLVAYVYAQLGIDLPHQSRSILNSARTTQISRAEAQPGDLIWSPGHISIYLGDGKQIEASRPQGWKVGVHNIWQSNPVFLRVS